MVALLLVALSVGLDNFGAAGALGISGTGSHHRLKVAVVFGVFEAGMPLLGLALGDSIARGLGGHAKLVAGLVLCLAGVFTLVQEHRTRDPAPTSEAPAAEPGLTRLIVLAAALSIDNLAIGFALATSHVNVVVAALVIGVVSVGLTSGRPGARQAAGVAIGSLG